MKRKLVFEEREGKHYYLVGQCVPEKKSGLEQFTRIITGANLQEKDPDEDGYVEVVAGDVMFTCTYKGVKVEQITGSNNKEIESFYYNDEDQSLFTELVDKVECMFYSWDE